MTIVGCTIVNPTGHESQVEQFIKDYCIFERPDIPHDIAYRAKDVNVFFNKIVTATEISNLPFSAIPIGYEPPAILMVSTVNFMLEFFFNRELIRLSPTGFITGVPRDIDRDTLRLLIRQGCLRVYGLKDAEGWYIGDFNTDFNLDFDATHEL